MTNTYVGIDIAKHQLDLAVWGCPKRTTAWPTTGRALRRSASACVTWSRP